MESSNERFPTSLLKQWVIYQGLDVCSGIDGSKNLKIMKNNIGSNCWMSSCILTLRNQQTAIAKVLAKTPGGTEATKLSQHCSKKM